MPPIIKNPKKQDIINQNDIVFIFLSPVLTQLNSYLSSDYITINNYCQK